MRAIHVFLKWICFRSFPYTSLMSVTVKYCNRFKSNKSAQNVQSKKAGKRGYGKYRTQLVAAKSIAANKTLSTFTFTFENAVQIL